MYRISKSDYLKSDNVVADKIEFTYENQENFENSGNSDWDAEALVVVENQLLIFTKQWQSKGTVAYQLSTEPGKHVAKRLDDYFVDGWLRERNIIRYQNHCLLLVTIQF